MVGNLILTHLEEIRKMTSIFLKMEEDLNFIENPRISQFDLKMEDIIKYLKNGPHFFL
jgi:hypothetical protein